MWDAYGTPSSERHSCLEHPFTADSNSATVLFFNLEGKLKENTLDDVQALRSLLLLKIISMSKKSQSAT